MLTKHVIAFNSFKSGKICWPETVTFFFLAYYLTLFKQGKPPIRPALYRESIFSRRLLFMRVMNKKELAHVADVVESGNMQFLQSVLMVFRCCVSPEYLADVEISLRSPLFQKLQVFILDLTARVRWTCKSDEGLFKILSKVIYCDFNGWCKTHRIKCTYGEELHIDVFLKLYRCNRESNCHSQIFKLTSSIPFNWLISLYEIIIKVIVMEF